MSELYLPRNQHTSTVVIESRVAEQVDETILRMLGQTSRIHVLGQQVVRQDVLYHDAVTGDNQPWPEPRSYILVDLAPNVERRATSLRWRKSHGGYPKVLRPGFVALTMYEQNYDQFVDVVVMPELGFSITES